MSRLVEDKVLYKPSNAGLALGIVMTLAIATSALAEDMLRLAIGQRGLWNTCISEVGQRSGIFKRHGINLEILYTQGSGETQRFERLLERSAGAHHRRRDEGRGRFVLVRESRLRDQDSARC
jgi:hypothetical protein